LPDAKLATLPRRVALAIGLGIFWGFAVLPGLYVAAFSVMAADAPGSAQNPAILTFIYACWAFPILAIIAALGGVVGALKGWSRVIGLTSAAPFAAVAVAASAMMLWGR
jgi:hypothetical protein